MSHVADQNRFIAIWRGIAVFIVAYYHFSDRLPYDVLGASAPATFPNHIGKLGVYVFFVISGYLIAKSLETCGNLADFLAKRISRIWPLFVLASVVIFIFASLFQTPVVLEGPKQFNEHQRTLLDLIGSSLFLSDLGFNFMDGVFWSIIVELKFYVYIGIFAVLFQRNYVSAFALFAVVISSVDFGILLATGGDNVSFVENGPLRPVGMILHGVLISQYLPMFALGAALFKKQIDATFGMLILLTVISAIIGVAEDLQFDPAVNLRFIFLLIGLLAVDHFVFKDRVFLWVGEYSYSIYLFHQLIGLTFIQAIAPMVGMDASIAVAFMLIFSMAFVMSRLAEWRFRRPLASLLKSIFATLGLAGLTLPNDRPLAQAALGSDQTAEPAVQRPTPA